MTHFEMALSIASVFASCAGLLYVRWIVRTSGRDRPYDPEAVQRFVDRHLEAEKARATKGQ